MENKLVTALRVEPSQTPRIAYLKADWNCVHDYVSDGTEYPCFAAVLCFGDDDKAVILCNEEAPLLGLPGNRRVGRYILAGVFYIVGIGEAGELTSLPKKALLKYAARFREPEYYTWQEVLDAYYDSFEHSIEDFSIL